MSYRPLQEPYEQLCWDWPINECESCGDTWRHCTVKNLCTTCEALQAYCVTVALCDECLADPRVQQDQGMVNIILDIRSRLSALDRQTPET